MHIYPFCFYNVFRNCAICSWYVRNALRKFLQIWHRCWLRPKDDFLFFIVDRGQRSNSLWHFFFLHSFVQLGCYSAPQSRNRRQICLYGFCVLLGRCVWDINVLNYGTSLQHIYIWGTVVHHKLIALLILSFRWQVTPWDEALYQSLNIPLQSGRTWMKIAPSLLHRGIQLWDNSRFHYNLK